MNNVGLLGRTQCWIVSAEQSDVTVCDCDRAKCLFWERAWLRASYFGAAIYKFSYWKKITAKLRQQVGQGLGSKLPGFSTAFSDKNTWSSLLNSKDHNLFRICFTFCLQHSL